MIRALPATFNDIRFRSRTEARWAVFMTELGVEWHYEYEGFALPSGYYLPDFWLPKTDGGCFVEVKGQDLTWIRGDPEVRILQELAEETKRNLFLFVGTPAEYQLSLVSYFGLDGKFKYESDRATRCHLVAGIDKGDSPYWWTVCRGCGVVGIEYDARFERVAHHSSCSYSGAHKEMGGNDSRIVRAMEAAKKWRSPEGD